MRRTGFTSGEPCGKTVHTEYRCLCLLKDAWHTEYGDEQDIPNWLALLGKGLVLLVLRFCYSCVPRAAGLEVAALGACESAAAGTAYAKALHTFTLDSGASHCFFRDYTTVTPLTAPVSVSLADPSWGPVVARASTVLPYSAVPSGSLPGLHIPSFSKNLVSSAVLQDDLVSTFTPGGERVAICSDSHIGEHLATYTRRPGSSLYTLTTESTQVAASGQMAASAQVAVSGQLAASCSCRLLSHKTLLWHHCLGHPSLSCLRGMHSRLLVSGLPRSLPPLPRSIAPPRLPSVEGRQCAAPHSSSFPPTTTPLQTLHMDVKADVRSVLIDWIIAVCCQMSARFQHDLKVLRLHCDRGGEFSSGLLQDFCRAEGIVQSFTLLASPQQNGIAERRIGLVMELNLWPLLSMLETLPTLRWMGEVGDASAFHVWGVLSLVHDTTAGKLSPHTLRCDVTFDESVCFYRLHPHASSPLSPLPLFLVPGPPSVEPLPPQDPAPSSVSHVEPPPLVEPLEVSFDTSGPAEGGDPAADDTPVTCRSPRLETPPGFPPRPSSRPPLPVAVDSGAVGGGDTRGADSRGAGPEVADPGGAVSGGAGSGGAVSGGADTGGAARPSGGGVVGAPAGLRDWVVRRGRVPGAWSTGAGGARAGGDGGTRAAVAGGARAAGAGGAGARGTGAAAGGTGCARARDTGGTGTAGAGGTGAASAGGAGAGGAGTGCLNIKRNELTKE
ncbi:unnamed protein product [Closterium sp. NIES-54]